MRLDAVEHRQCVLRGRRREPEGDVLQHLHQHAAEAEGNELAERTVGDGPDDDLGPARQHLLDLDTLDLGIGLVFSGIGQDGLERHFRIGGGLDAHHDATGLGLVQDIGRDDLHHHRETHVGRELRGIGCRLGDAFLRHRDSVGVADDLAFRRRETGALVRLDLIEDLADRIFGI